MTSVRFAHLGIRHPHSAQMRETLLLMPEQVELVALYDPDPAARADLPERQRQLPFYDDLAALLARERPEAVQITLPNDLTPSAIASAAGAGAHVYADKPCARTADELRPAAEAIRRAGVQFTAGYLRRLYGPGAAIAEVVARGLLGRLISVEARWVTTSVARRDPTSFVFSAARSGGGVLHWECCHWLDMMRWATGAEPIEVTSIGDTLSGEAIDVEDVAAVALRFDNGVVGSLHGAYVTDRATDGLFFALRGTGGWLRWDRSQPRLEVRSSDPSWAAAPTRAVDFRPDQPVGGYAGAVGIAAVRQFVASFREGGPPLCTVADALRVLEMLDAAAESRRTNRRVSLEVQ